jgi:hypothetical protein
MFKPACGGTGIADNVRAGLDGFNASRKHS